MTIERSAGTIIFSKQGAKILYLLLHYQSGHWDFPKGHIEQGEKLEQTALREAAEETGLTDLQLLVGFKRTMRYFFRQEGQMILKFVTFFVVRAKTTEVTLSDEHIGFTWLAYEQALAQLTFKTARTMLEQANNFLNNGPTSAQQKSIF